MADLYMEPTLGLGDTYSAPEIPSVEPQESTPTLALAPVSNDQAQADPVQVDPMKGFPEVQPGALPNYSMSVPQENGLSLAGVSPPPQELGFFERMFADASAKQQARKSMREEYIATLSPREKFALAMQDFGNSLQGKGLQSDREIAQYHQERRLEREEKRQGMDAILKGADILNKLPQEQRAPFIAAYMPTLPAEARPYFEKLATTDRGAELLAALRDPRIVEAVKKMGPLIAQKIIDNPTDPIVTKLQADFDKADLPNIHKKIELMFSNQLLKDVIGPKKAPSFADLVKMNDANPIAALKLTPFDLATAERNQKELIRHGIFTDEQVGQLKLDEAKKQNKEVAPHATVDVGGKRYQYDPQKKLPGQRLASNPDYAELGSVKDDDVVKALKDGIIDEREARHIERIGEAYRTRTKDFAPVRAEFLLTTDYMAKLAKDITKRDSVEDRALTGAYLKSIDKNDRITEGDWKSTKKLGGIPERIVAGIDSVVGGSLLPDRVRADMYEVIKRKFSLANDAQRALEKHYSGQAEGLVKRKDAASLAVGEPLSINLPKPAPDPETFGAKPAAEPAKKRTGRFTN